MGRPETDLDPGRGPVQRFAFELRKLRQEAGDITYRQMARQVEISVTTLSRAAKGEQLPSLPVALAYVQACGGDAQEWERRWLEAVTEQARVADLVGDGTIPSPYRGLARFDVDDAELFFGRDEMTDALVRAVTGHRVFAVFGPSGSGKSSLLRAGLIPRLRSLGGPHRPQAVRILTPGEHPLRTHDTVCDPVPGEGDTWLVVDQFEEVFTLCRDTGERAGFLARLLAAAEPGSRLRVVLGVRADFYGRCAEHRELADALREANLLVGPMSPAELREAVVKPAQAAGLIVERELTARLVEEVSGEPGGLPLLSHVLRETWRRRRGRVLTMEAYEAAGGVHGAIAQTAEEIYTRLSPDHAELARLILLRLIAPGEGFQDTRRPINRTELGFAPVDEVAVVLDHLARARLLTLDDDAVDLAHEALITAWPRLSGWIGEARERLRTHRRLTEAAHAWDELGRDAGALYRGIRLATAEEHFGDTLPGDLTLLEHDFLTAGLAAREQEERTAARTTRRLRGLTATLSVLLVLAVTAGLIASHQSRIGEQRRQVADAAWQVALSRQLAAQSAAFDGSNSDLASLLAIHAYRTSPTSQAVESLYNAAAVPLRNRLTRHSGPVASVAFSPDGRTVATVGGDGILWLWGAATGRLRKSIDADGARSVAFSPDGRTVATAGGDGTLRLWGAATGRLRKSIDADGARSVAFSPDGRSLATVGGGDGILRLRDTATGRLREKSPEAAVAAHSVAFSPDGRTVATGGDDRIVRLWNTDTGRTRAALAGHQGAVISLAFSRDGRTVATGSVDRTVRLWNPDTGRFQRSLPEIGYGVSSLAFSPDGRTLATGSFGAQPVRLWDTDIGRFQRSLPGHASGVSSLAFSPDGRTLATGSFGAQPVRLWDTDIGRFQRSLPGHASGVSSLAFSPDGRTLATGDKDGTARLWDMSANQPRDLLTRRFKEADLMELNPGGLTLAAGNIGVEPVRLWDVTTGRLRAILDGHTKNADSMAFSPDGTTLATASRSRPGVDLWNTATGRLRARLDKHTVPSVNSVAFSPDGRTLATGSYNTGVQLWNATTGHFRRNLLQDTVPATSVAFSPDGRTLATGGEDGTVRLWDTRTGRGRESLSGHGGEVTTVVYSPDGRTLATGGAEDDTVRLWDTRTGRGREGLSGHGGEVTTVVYSPDGRTLATGGAEDDTVRLWDTRTGRGREGLSGHGGEVTTVVYSPDGRTLATSSRGDHTVRLWDADTGGALATLSKHTGTPLSLAFSPDGHTLTTSSADQTVRRWNVALPTPTEAISEICRAVGRDLTAKERSVYLADQPPHTMCPNRTP
ncbi:helix-turn-helix domain-containing protein [Streptomyces beigongshangae]|uniref:nSTAND1 domain-containing NTPase n=1 Tax=Streptomyces beigongshangae TaxID=2841597 RepID=UPI001C85BEF1|nr:helix-turn-helix domain-containing protein [Streptomyces sp. REN17]